MGKKCKKKSKQNGHSRTNHSSKENVVVEIDYEKLADTIIKANIETQRQQEQKRIEEYEEQHGAWLKALLKNNYCGNPNYEPSGWQIFKGLMFFKQENATQENAIYALFKICNDCLLGLYKWVFYIVTLLCVLASLFELCSCGYLEVQTIYSLVIYILVAIFTLIIGRIVRIVQMENSNLRDKNAITMLFNALVTFTAMLFTIVSVIIALETGGV